MFLGWSAAPGLIQDAIPDSTPEATPACCRSEAGRAATILAAARQETVRPAVRPSGTDENVAALLDSIDARSESLRGFHSRIRMDSYDDLADETERRFGRVWMTIPESGRPSDRMAAVVFERTVESSGRIRERLEHYVYRDCILSDYDHEARRLVRRRVCEPDDPRDPLRLGEGPIPIPIGQRKE